MEHIAVPVSDQVREVVQAVVEALQAPKVDEISPLVTANSFEADALRAEIIRVGRKLWERQYERSPWIKVCALYADHAEQRGLGARRHLPFRFGREHSCR